MTYSKPNATEQRQLMYECPVCGEKPGKWCLTYKGERTSNLHTGRPQSDAQVIGKPRKSTRIHFHHPEEHVPACMVIDICVLRSEVCTATPERDKVTCNECRYFLHWERELTNIIWTTPIGPIEEDITEVARRIIAAGYRKERDDD